MKEESRPPISPDPSPVIARALQIEPDRKTGTLKDVRHVVILMQENRSFDHYFGTLPGVRGFADPHPAPTRAGTVMTQTDGQARCRPYDLQAEVPSDKPVGYITPHTWDDSQRAWNDGRMDQWLSAKSRLGLGVYRSADVPFQTALANAFTLCDAYHCSIQAGTNPNRLFLWTGTNDPLGAAGGPALVNTFDRLGPAGEGYAWTTYPERLQDAGMDWRIYQDMADNYNDNPLAGFRQYRRQHEGSAGDAPLRDRALATRTLDDLARDVAQGTLPAVSWIIAPTADSEHPEVSSPRRGGAYTERVLDILTSSSDTWSRCVLFVTYDENDCFFDHMPRPRRQRDIRTASRAACRPWSWTANTTTRGRVPARPRPTIRRACTGAPSAWGRACRCWWYRPGAAADGSIRRCSTTPRSSDFWKCGSAWPNPTSAPGAARWPAT